MSDKSGMELVADCHGATDVNLTTALGFCSMTSSIESLERLERAHELVTSLSMEVFTGELQTEQKIGGWREALENEMSLKDSEAYHRPTGSKYLVGSSSAPYCNSRYHTHMVVMDARTQQVLIDQLFSVLKCVRLARMSERSYDLLAKVFWAVPKRSEGELQDVVGEEFMRLNEGNVSEFQKQKACGALPTEFPTIEEKDDLHRIMMEVEPLLGASGYWMDPKENIEDPWGVSLSLLGADVMVPQTRESDASMGRGGVVLYGVARSESTGVNRGG